VLREAERMLTELTFTEDCQTQELALPETTAMAQVHATASVSSSSCDASPDRVCLF
jgi:hypothetical protein